MTTGKRIAYFCMEYGLHETFPIYSGGLGVLAGDTMKAAADQACNFVGLGILWDEGYTVQKIDPEGRPYDEYPKTPRDKLEKLEVSVEVTIENRPVALRAYLLRAFGSAPLYLLEPVAEEHQWITRRLYAGAGKARVAQELVLGVGGIRLLRALGHQVDVYHFNEGHALFAGFELMRERMAEGASFDQAREQCRDRIAFTTHTPVKAGNETHPVDLLLEMGAGLGVMTRDDLIGLAGEPFQMTVGALRLAKVANAVAQLHGTTARKMWADVNDGAPIASITNGIHLGTWQDGRIRELNAQGGVDQHLWMVHQELKTELIEEIARRTGIKLAVDKLLVGFARRAATYKRATLILRDLAWLEPQLAEGKLQIVFSGKAHPEDHGGKDVVAEIVALSRKYPNQIVFLENYDMGLGRVLTRGCDVWLNTPTRPLEASGTSGMKAAANGILNVSILDGWWDEGCEHGKNGWQFGDAFEGEGADAHDLDALQRVMDSEVIPTYYNDRNRWVAMMRAAIKTGQTRFSAGRMLSDYFSTMYEACGCS
ncbi:MAG: alpha-glucan family phosphorylase [Myxococcota bacterium]|nr:alpha-glucan family phosphorylase [Myxococcota bacterium]